MNVNKIVGDTSYDTLCEWVLRVSHTHNVSRKQAYFNFQRRLSKIPGIGFQQITGKAKSSFQNMVIIIEEDEFGLSRDRLQLALDKENIMSKRYFYPALHQMGLFKKVARFKLKDLPNTEYLSRRTLCLPLYPFMSETVIKGICQAIEDIHRHAKIIKRR